VRWHKLGEVENKYTPEKLVFFAIFVPKIFTIGRNLTKFWQKISLHSFFWDTVYIVLFHSTNDEQKLKSVIMSISQ